MHTEYVTYADDDEELEGYLVYGSDRDQPAPAVLVCHTWAGQSDFERGKAEELARLGYVGFAIDVYGKGRRGTSVAENQALMAPFVQDRALLRGRLGAALNTVRALDMVDAGRIAVIGFCFGGLCALDVARANATVRGVAAIHGLLMPPDLADNPRSIQPRVLAIHGNDDPFVPPDELDAFRAEMDSLGADWQLHVLGGERHAFTHREAHNPELGNVYSDRAAHRAGRELTTFLTECFE